LQRQAREASEMLEAVLQQGRTAREQLREVVEHRQEVGREIQSLRQQFLASQEQVLREAQELRQAHQQIIEDIRHAHEAQKQLGQLTRQGADNIKEACTSVSSQIADAGRQFQGVRQQALHDFSADIDLLRKRLAETKQSFAELPQLVGEFGRGLTDAATQIRVFEEAAEAARQKRDAIEHAARLADLHLTSLRQETTQAESRLAELRKELAALESKKTESERQITDFEKRLGQASLHAERPAERPAEPPAATTAEPEGHNRLGVTVDPGVVVAEVDAGSPGALAGLVRGDVINTVNGTPIVTGMELRDLIHNHTDQTPVTLRVTHGEVAREIQVALAEANEEKSSEGRNRLGVTVDPAVVVAEVEPGTPAATAGLMRGDIINTLNDTTILTGAQLRQVVHSLGEFAEITLRFTRGGEGHEAKTRLDEVLATA